LCLLAREFASDAAMVQSVGAGCIDARRPSTGALLNKAQAQDEDLGKGCIVSRLIQYPKMLILSWRGVRLAKDARRRCSPSAAARHHFLGARKIVRRADDDERELVGIEEAARDCALVPLKPEPGGTGAITQAGTA